VRGCAFTLSAHGGRQFKKRRKPQNTRSRKYEEVYYEDEYDDYHPDAEIVFLEYTATIQGNKMSVYSEFIGNIITFTKQ
jgi:hypothetical protein